MRLNTSNMISRVVLGALVVSVCLVGGHKRASAKADLSDTSITDAVENQFLFDSAVPYNDIDVSTSQGIVTLDGKVNNILAADRAVEIAETIRGVRSVVDRIAVKPTVARSDKAVRRNVINRLLLDPATDSYEIGVKVADGGLVTLTGTVDSWAEKRLCGVVARGAAGVTGLENDLDVAYKRNRPDGEIKPEIKKRLQWDALVDDAKIDVDVQKGNVSLTGAVGSAAEKNRALWDAWVAGVRSVDASKLDVKPWTHDDNVRRTKYVVKPDDEIRDAVKDALRYDPRVFSFDVMPKVASGAVTLDGIVDNAEAKRAAELDARNTVGVTDVTNRIKVRTKTDISDTTIAGNVRMSLQLDPVLAPYGLSVRVSGGIVSLYGTVDTIFEKMHAENVASRSTGVVDIRNHLDVTFPDRFEQSPYVYPYWYYSYPLETRVFEQPQGSDQDITDEIREELWWSPFVDDRNVNVSVEDGVATLTGTVDSWRAYNAARSNALEAGAVRVVNKLKVD